MRFRRAKPLLFAGAALLLAIPALSQDRDSPESLLPPGFGDPQTLPPPEEKAAPRPRPQQPGQVTPGGPATPAGADPGLGANVVDGVEEVEVDPTQLPRPTNYFTIPEGVERPVDLVGPLERGNFGLGHDAFARINGRFLTSLMRQLDAPLPSRWTSILLRRALLSRMTAPPGVDPVDWVAERAALLLKMGEADAARMLVQAVDTENYTPRMIEVAGQTALATADPAALCPLVAPARQRSSDPVWILADGMCAALEGEAARASALIDEARGRVGTSIDVLLAEKVVGAGAESRRGVEIDWQGVNAIDAWRFGLASATGVQIPPPLLARTRPEIQAWLARAPMVPLEQRLNAASVAASLGVFSSHSLVEAHSLMFDQTDPAEQEGTVGARLRRAWIDPDPARRVESMRSLWTESEAPVERQARLILTAGAAARIPASDAFAGDMSNLIASMLTAGLDRQAARWAGVIEAAGESNRAWGMLALAAPRPVVGLDPGRIAGFEEADDSRGARRSQLLVAALAGLERISPDQAAQAGFRLGEEDPWTRVLDQAVQARSAGGVALLSAVGMQTADWSGVPPRYLYRITRALRAVGMDYEARMIAAEAIARL